MVSYLQALLAHHECNWGQVVLLAENTKLQPKSQLLWMKKLLLLAEATHNFTRESTTFQFSTTDRGFTRAVSLLRDGVNTIDGMHTTSKNKLKQAPYIRAKLMNKLGCVYLTESEGHLGSVGVRQSLLSEAKRAIAESYTQLLQLGYVVEGVQAMRTAVDINMKLLNFATNDNNINNNISNSNNSNNSSGEKRKELLLEAFDIGTKALDTVCGLMMEIAELTTSEDVGHMHLPVQDEVHACQLKLMEVIIIIINYCHNCHRQITKLELICFLACRGETKLFS